MVGTERMSARAVARVSLSPAQQWGQALRHYGRTATTFSAQDVGVSPANPHRSHENSNFRGSKTASLRSPESPTLRKPETNCRVGTSGPGHGRDEAGGTASLDSPYLGQADDVHAMRSAYNNDQENYVTNATGIANPDSMPPPLERDLPRPDAASGVMNQTPPKNPFAAINQRSQGDIPQQHNSSSLSQAYHVRKARIHATLWQQELRNRAGDLEANADLSADPLVSTLDSRKSKDNFGWDVNKTVPEDWETFDPPEGEFYDESPAKEEALMFEEFEKRRERNRIQIASFVKQHLYGRRRPVDGWKYIINNFGTDNKAAKGSALGGRQTTGNDLEKLALKRESSRLRKKA